MSKEKQTFSLLRVVNAINSFFLLLGLLMLVGILGIFKSLAIIVFIFLFKKKIFLLCEKINGKNLILGGIITMLLLGNIYFVNQYNQVNNLCSKLKKINTNTNEYQFSIFSIEEYPFGNYCNCDSFCDDYDDCVDSVTDSEYSCVECIEKQNECAEEYNECSDDYNDLVRQIDEILE